MRSLVVDGKARLLTWRHVRDFAVPASMIETAAARRNAGDWAGACAAAHVDVDLDFRAVTRARGRAFTATLRADLRRLAPDLLRSHLPRAGADGLLRAGLTITLARYRDHGLHLVVRTAPAWADSGQRISLALWGSGAQNPGRHPRPRPDRRFRLDLHPHLWAADRVADLPGRCGADRWPAEAAILRAADGHDGPVVVRLGGGRRLLVDADDTRPLRTGDGAATAVLPYAATYLPPDLELLHAGMISLDDLHPLVAEALTGTAPPGAARPRRAGIARPGRAGTARPRRAAASPEGRTDGIRLVECCGETHRLGLTDGVFVPLDHSPEDLRREELLAALGGPPLPCLRVIDTESREPDRLDEVRTRLDHGDHTGALAIVEALLGPGARLPDGPLLDAFTDATEARIGHGLYRAGLAASPAWANTRVPAWMRVAPGLRSTRTGRASRTGRPGRYGRAGRINRVRLISRADRADRAGRRGRHHRLPKRCPAPH